MPVRKSIDLEALDRRMVEVERKVENTSPDQRTCCEHRWYQAGAIGPGATYQVGGFDVCKECMEKGWLDYLHFQAELKASRDSKDGL